MPYGTQTKTRDYTSNGKVKPTGLLQVIKWGITGVIGLIIFANVKPYEIIADKFFMGIQYTGLTQFFLSVPLIGGLFRWVLNIFSFTAGVIIWLVIQGLELLPTELLGHERFLDKNIERANTNQYQLNKKEAWEVKVAKRLRNSLSTEILRFLIILGVTTYVVDFFACLTVFPPVVGGGNIWKFFDVIQVGQWSKVDGGNILKAIATVGAVQLLVRLRKIINRIIDDLALAKE